MKILFTSCFQWRADHLIKPSNEYWFKCLDLDENGQLTPDEMKLFMRSSMSENEMPFEDVLRPNTRHDCTRGPFKLSLILGNRMETGNDNADASSSSSNSFYTFPPLPPIILPRSPSNQEEGNIPPLFDPPLQLALRNHHEIMRQSLKEQYILRISHFFDNPLGGFRINDAEFKSVITKKVCQLPSFFSAALFRKIDIKSSGIVTRRGNGRLSLRELKRGNLIPAMQRVDDEEDTDGVLRYFSYKQFYVIYRKFGEVDANHDFLIDQGDLLTYGDGALTSRIVARIFEQASLCPIAPRKFTCEVARHMNYEDFVYFLISVEDKSSEPSVEYWFKLLDLDGNGKLTPGEMRYFYEDHAKKPVSFEMILCQIIDMIAPEREEYITLRDLKRSDLSRIVFEVLSNRGKLLAFDDRVRFPLPRRRGHQHPDLIEWLRFVDKEFESMLIDAEFISSSEDEPMEDWGEPIEEMHD
ncbi:serine/threonine protein phosphatase 2A regulatory subunit B''alpha [Citrus sinensis]|nr:serine/threonine protein phosphatase 2A regulatory subunit B''alpha [Citrus sinensis]